jgi:acylphosphatase
MMDPLVPLLARRCIVRGRVQGVFYRATAREKAESLGVAGYARNLPDGTVEVLAVGAADQVNEFVQWLWQGSPSSHVTAVDVEELDPGSLDETPAGFHTR